VSDTCANDATKDASGPALRQFVLEKPADAPWDVDSTEIVPDDVQRIQSAVMTACNRGVDVVLLTGGTGFGTRDLTPEAVSAILEKQAPGLVVAMLVESLKITPFAVLSRPVAGIIGRSIVITLPGSPKAAKENLAAIWPALGHAVDLVRGGKGEATHQKMQSTTVSCPHKSYPLHQPLARRPRQSTFGIISVKDAHRLIFARTKPLGIETRSVNEKLVGYVCAETVNAKENVPAFRASIVDGYAMHAPDGAGVYPVAQAVLTGSVGTTLAPGTIARVNTGAPIPDGADGVVMVEYTTVAKSSRDGKHEESIEIHEAIRAGDNIREVGSDCTAGTAILEKGELVTLVGGEVGILTSVGISELKVYKKPKVGVLSTGSEIVNVGQELQLGQVRDSNRPTLLAAISSCGFEALDCGIVSDDEASIQKRLESALETCDVLITTGGVSMGEADLLKPIIEHKLGGSIHFGRVQMKPGKPTTFATVGSKPIFALPGNPVSAIVTFFVFVLPGLKQMAGYSQVLPSTIQATIDCDYELDARPEYVRAYVSWKNNGFMANVTGNQRSSRMLSMKGANALLQLPGSTNTVKQLSAGTLVDAFLISHA